MITSKQRAYLRSLASNLDTIFQIGKGGITEETCLQISNALEARELIKARVLDNSGYTSKEAANEMYEASTVSKKADATAEEIATALAELQAKYDALLAGYNDPTDISGVVINTPKMQGIYDLSGRRLNKITTPGLYIIDGQKRFVK